MILSCLGSRGSALQSECDAMCRLIYDLTTTLADRRTLGEEYCDLRRVTTKTEIPSRSTLASLVILKSIVPYSVHKIVNNARVFPHNLWHSSSVCTRFVNLLVSFIKRIAPFFTNIRLLHLAAFYLFGKSVLIVFPPISCENTHTHTHTRAHT